MFSTHIAHHAMIPLVCPGGSRESIENVSLVRELYHFNEEEGDRGRGTETERSRVGGTAAEKVEKSNLEQASGSLILVIRANGVPYVETANEIIPSNERVRHGSRYTCALYIYPIVRARLSRLRSGPYCYSLSVLVCVSPFKIVTLDGLRLGS